MPEPRPTQRATASVLPMLMVLVGLALIVRTLLAGGGALATGLILGVLFVAAGVGRVYLGRMRR